MTVTEAAKVWLEEKPEIDRRTARMKAAAEVLKTYFEKTGKQDYRGKIGYAVLSRRQLDTDKVKAELGERLSDFQKRITYSQLSLLKP